MTRASKTGTALALLAALALIIAALATTHALPSLFSTAYLPHRFCYLAQPGLIWTNVSTDALIAVSYAAIFACLFWIAVRLRRVAGFREYLWIFVAFGIFIAACGATHAMEVVTVWWPLYPFSAAVKVLCALASVPTAILFARAAPAIARKIPEVLHLLSELEHQRDRAMQELVTVEQALEDREKAEAETAAAYTQLNHILDSSSEGIFKLRHDWTVAYANRKAFEILPDLGLEKSYWVCFHDAIGTEIETNLQNTMKNRVPTQWENYWEPYDAWFAVHAYPTEGGLSVFFIHITALKKTEQLLQAELELRRQREKTLEADHSLLNHILDSTSEGILKIDLDWTLLYGNRRAFETLADLRIGASLWDCFPATLGTDAERAVRKSMEQCVETQWEIFYEPYQEWFETHCFPTVGGLTLFFTLTTARKKLELQLEAERLLREKRIVALSNMAGGLAHEISNPLAIIHGVASNLLRQVGDPKSLPVEEIRKASESIVTTADRASRILRGLRSFARDGAQDPKEFASIYEIVEQIVQMQETRFDRHRVELRSDLQPGIPLLLCREVQVGQIVTNLLNNAFDAIVELDCPERWISIAGRQNGDFIEIDITDSGFGIDEDAREHMMEPFFTTKTRGLGMGVGLSLSRAIADEHGGTLELSQDRTHTCFRLTLPLQHEDALAAELSFGDSQ